MYCTGNWEFEFCATLSTEKSLVMNEYTRHSHANVTKNAWPRTAGRAIAIHTRSPRAAPAMGSTPWTSVSRSARIEGKPIERVQVSVAGGEFAYAFD